MSEPAKRTMRPLRRPHQGDDMTPSTGAELSEDGRYRYLLWRRWGASPSMVWVMLNPSTADAHSDDPTIRRIVNFAKREGCGGIEVINLYPYRSTKPADLVAAIRAGEPVHDARSMMTTRGVLRAAFVTGAPVVAAWGATPVTTGLIRNSTYWGQLVAADRVRCLGRTKSGRPRHPLYVRADQPFEVFA